MVIRYVTGTVRGVTAWAVGYLVVALLLALDIVNGTGILKTAAEIYINAHTVPGITGPFEWIVLVPIVIIGIVGFRLGSSVGRGLIGRTKALIAGRGDSRPYRFKKAGKQLTIFGIGYLLATLIVGTLAGVEAQSGLVNAAILVLVVGAPVVVVGIILAER